ncbi:CHAT domain-containing protein [Nonomuraea turkmeniaca]|uniref:CHAT domain-containing protein n=1 Tax=Nonomuraea turkmeniaca TaxID=103838 RepID=A0A5S4FMN4_9ACTN|nr:CHAT domain-containing protein [Nonomuraea turkmeniaca]TMR21986.1 CHAT domain-containing protein [Nonomuraea turkmeniaca]
MRDQLLNALRGRLVTVSSTGDPAGVLDPEALAEAERLLDFLATREGADQDVLHAVGLLHWLRTAVLGAESSQEDRGNAVVLLMPIYLAQPDALPDQVRASFAETLGPDDPVGEERAHAFAEALSNLAMFLLERCTRRQRRVDAEAAVALLRGAAPRLPAGHPSRAPVLCNLGYALMMNDALTSSEDDSPEPPNIDEALAVLREAFQGTAREHGNHARCANGLALAVRTKALGTRDTALLSESIELFRLAVDTATDMDHNLPQMLTDLGFSLLLWVDAAGEADPAVVDEAVSALRRAVRHTPEHGAERRTRLRLLAKAELLRTPKPAAPRLSPETQRRVDELTALFGQAIPATSGDASNEPDNWLAVVTRLLGIAPSDGQGSYAQLMDLLAGLLRDPSGTDLERKAFELMQRRTSHLRPDDRLDAMLTQMFVPAGAPSAPVDTASLDEVLELLERMLRELPDDHPERPVLAMTQIMTQLARRHRPGEPGGIGQMEERLALLTRSMEMLPSLMGSLNMSPAVVGDMSMMSNALVSPFETLALIEDTLKRNRERLAALPEGGPEHTVTLKTLAHTLFQQYQLAHEESAYQEAAGLARRVVAADPAQARRIVVAWATAARLRAMSAALGQVPAGEHDLRSSGLARLSSNEAVSAIGNSDAPAALEALEEGRALLLSSALNARRELENLRAADSRLAERFVAMRERIRAVSVDVGREPAQEELARLGGMAAEWSELVRRIQALPEFGRFLMPLPLGMPDLGPAAAEGPVVTVNVNPRRCDALALCADGVRLVPLPDLRAAELIEQAEAFHDAIRTARTGPALLAGQAQQVVLDTLGWLWDVLAEPVLRELGCTGPSEDGSWPRLWWSPTGPLNGLPLHAAGHHTTAGASVLDRVVSSYTPTLRALLHSRSRPVPSRRAGLTVAMPDTPGHAALPETAGEAVEVTARIHGLALTGPEASRAAVLAALPRATVAHFACHASSDPYNPSASHLLLHDGPLSVTEISRLRLDDAELAYLSACATARGSARLADEAIHLASAFQLAGYAQAVATLWEIGDHVAATMAADFHRELRDTVDAPVRMPGALALHTATRRMRAAMPGRPSAWAAFLHSGA